MGLTKSNGVNNNAKFAIGAILVISSVYFGGVFMASSFIEGAVSAKNEDIKKLILTNKFNEFEVDQKFTRGFFESEGFVSIGVKGHPETGVVKFNYIIKNEIMVLIKGKVQNASFQIIEEGGMSKYVSTNLNGPIFEGNWKGGVGSMHSNGFLMHREALNGVKVDVDVGVMDVIFGEGQGESSLSISKIAFMSPQNKGVSIDFTGLTANMSLDENNKIKSSHLGVSSIKSPVVTIGGFNFDLGVLRTPDRGSFSVKLSSKEVSPANLGMGKVTAGFELGLSMNNVSLVGLNYFMDRNSGRNGSAVLTKEDQAQYKSLVASGFEVNVDKLLVNVPNMIDLNLSSKIKMLPSLYNEASFANNTKIELEVEAKGNALGVYGAMLPELASGKVNFNYEKGVVMINSKSSPQYAAPLLSALTGMDSALGMGKSK